jgi:hypothetical protein
MATQAADFNLVVEANVAIIKNVTFSLEVREAPDFFLVVAPTALVVDKGAVASFVVTATAKGTYSKNIALTLAGLPGSVVASFSVNPMGPNGSSTVTIPTVNIPIGILALILTGTEVA